MKKTNILAIPDAMVANKVTDDLGDRKINSFALLPKFMNSKPKVEIISSTINQNMCKYVTGIILGPYI